MKIIVEFETENAAFDTGADDEVSHVLKQVQDMICGQKNFGKLYDSNGNHIGKVEYA